MANDLQIKVQVQADQATAALKKLDDSMKSLQRSTEQTFKVDELASKAEASFFKYDAVIKGTSTTFKNVETSYNNMSKQLSSTEKIGNIADKVDRLGNSGLRLAADLGVSNDAIFKAGSAMTGIGDVIDKTLQSGWNPLALGITAVSVAVPLLISAFSEQKRSLDEITKDVEELSGSFKKLEDVQREIAYSETMSKMFAKDLDSLKAYQKSVNVLQQNIGKEYIETFSAKNLSGKAKDEYKKIEQANTDLMLQMARANQFGVVGMEKTISDTTLKLAELFSETNAAALSEDKAVQQMIKSYQKMGVDVSSFTVLANIFGNDTYAAMIKAADGNEFLQKKLKGFEAIFQQNIDAVKKQENVETKRNQAALDNTIELRNNRIEYYKTLDSIDKVVNDKLIDRDNIMKDMRVKNARELEQILKKPVGFIGVNDTGNLVANFKANASELQAIQIQNQKVLLESQDKFYQDYTAALQAFGDVSKEALSAALAPSLAEDQNETAINSFETMREKMREVSLETIGLQAGIDAVNGTGQVLADTFFQVGEALTASKEAQKGLGEIFLQNAAKMAAGVIKQVAMQAYVKAAWEVAEGFAALAGVATAPLAPGHFAAAAKYAAVGTIAGLAGGAISGLAGGGATQKETATTDKNAITKPIGGGVGSTTSTTINLYGDLYQNDLEKMKRQQEMLNAQYMQAG